MRIEQMKNVDIRIVNPKSLVSVNFLTYTTCIKKCEAIKMRLLNIPKMYKEELLYSYLLRLAEANRFSTSTINLAAEEKLSLSCICLLKA